MSGAIPRGDGTNRVHLATAGLFAAWIVHDLEELATMSASSRALVRRLPQWVPVPASIRQRGLTQRYLTTGIRAVGVVMATASIRGYRTRGRSPFYQNALLAFGLHGLGHIGASVLARGYTSGVATGPTVVVPFWLWATRALGQAGVPNRRSVPGAMRFLAGAVASGHLTAYLVTKNQERAAAPALAARFVREPRRPRDTAAPPRSPTDRATHARVTSHMNEPINLAHTLALFEERFAPRIVATMNDYKVEVVKVEGEFVWHSHPETDDFFLVLDGELEIELRDRTVHLGKGNCSWCRAASNIVPALAEAHILLIEPQGTPNTGDAPDSELTATETNDLALRPRPLDFPMTSEDY